MDVSNLPSTQFQVLANFEREILREKKWWNYTPIRRKSEIIEKQMNYDLNWRRLS